MKKTRFGALLAAGLLTLTFAGTALAATFTWGGNGYPNETCNDGSTGMLWIWTGDSPSGLTINGVAQSGSWVEKGQGSWHFEVAVTGTNYPPTSASIDYSGDAGVLTLSHCDGTTTTTTTTTTESTDTQTTETTTTTTTTTQSTETETTSTTTSTTTSKTTTPEGSVEELTPPSTDTLAEPTSSSTVSTGLLLVLAGILAAALVVIPAAARSRR